MSEINREDAIANVALAIWHYPNELYTSLNCFENCQELAERALNCLPSAEPKRKNGKWVKDYYGNIICSECKGYRRDSRVGHMFFCNCCGADMRQREDENV